MLKKLLFVPLFLLFFSAPLHADDSAVATAPTTFDLGMVEVEALSWNHPEFITGKPDGETFFEILPATGRSTLTESLDGQMGIYLRSSGGAGTVAAISAGGLSGNKILVVKDGLPVNDLFSGTPDIGDYSTLQFEQAEFWQGNRATLWGSNSIGGTLRLISRFPDYGRLRLWTDGHGGRGHAIETRVYPGKVKLGVRVAQFKTPGFSVAAAESGNGERDGFSFDNGYVAMEADLHDDLQLQMSAEFNRSLTDLDGFDFVSALPADNLTFRQKKINSQFNAGFVKRVSDGEFRLTHAFGHSNLTGIDESNPFNEYGLETSRQRQAISRSFLTEQNSWLVEVSRSEIRAHNTGIFSGRETDCAGLTACESRLNKDTTMNAVFRHDDPQNHKAVSTGNLSLQHDLNGFSVTAAWGRAFRMPALNERYYPAYGDPDLGAEFSTSHGLTVSRQINGFGRLVLGATNYYVTDLIGTTATSDPAYTWGIKAANLDRAKIRSQQISLNDCRFSGVKLNGNFTITDKARLENTGKQAPGIATRQAAVMLEKKAGQIDLACQGRWWGPTWEDAENKKSAPASHEISLFLSRDFKECSFEVGFLNITDTTRQRVIGYTRAGRRLTLAFETSF